MTTPSDPRVRHRLRNIVALLLIIAFIVSAVLFVRAFGPDSAVLEQRAADRAAWEKTQTAGQRADSAAWHEAVREWQRQRGLIALVFLLGNIVIVVTCIRSTVANARGLAAGQLRRGAALRRVLSRGTIALGVACAIMIAVPVAESGVAAGNGMYSGEQMLAALFTMISFLLIWMLSLGFAAIVLWRRGRAHAAAPGPSPK
jgi:hypothetical protein